MNTDTLIDLAAALLKITAVLLLAIALIQLLRRAEPRWRVLVARATLVALPLLIIASALEPRFALPLLPQATATAPAIPLAVAALPPFESAALSSLALPAAAPLPHPATWLIAAWFLVALALTLRETIRLRRFDSVRGLANTVLADKTLIAEWNRACTELGIRAPELRVSREKASPFLTSGFFKALVIPEQLSRAGNLERHRHVFRHEAAHLAHHDRAWIPLARILTCLLWFHPLAWWLESLHLRACEEACDAEAARRGGAQAYSAALAALALELVPQHSPATALLRLPSVRDRLRAVQHHARLQPPTRLKLLPLAAAVTLAALFAGNLGIAQQSAPTSEPAPESAPARNPTEKKLQSIIVPKVEFNDTPFEDAVAFLRHKSRELDPEKLGVNILIAQDAVPGPGKRVTLVLTNVPLVEALRYTTRLAGTSFRVDPSSVVITAIAEKPVPAISADSGGGPPPAPATGPGKTAGKLAAIQISSLDFSDAPLRDAINYLRAVSAQLDSGKQGINIIVAPGVDLENKISLRLTNISLDAALRYVTELSQNKYRVEPEAVFITPLTKAPTDLLYTMVYALPKNIFEAECRRHGKTEAKDLLVEIGVAFPPGAAAIYNAAGDQLIIRNTQPQNDLVTAWVDAAIETPPAASPKP